MATGLHLTGVVFQIVKGWLQEHHQQQELKHPGDHGKDVQSQGHQESTADTRQLCYVGLAQDLGDPEFPILHLRKSHPSLVSQFQC